MDNDPTRGINAACKLTKKHLSPDNGMAMRVFAACQIFSHSVASALRSYIDNGKISGDAKDTADFVEMVNEMWDFMDSNNLRKPIGQKSVQASQ